MQSKRIIVFGATGGTGQAIVRQALDSGHQVTAFVRTNSRPLPAHPRLTIAIGDVLRPETLPDALRGQDAVLCALGRKPFVSEPVCSVGTKNVLDAMIRQGIRPIVVESSVGVGDSFTRCGAFQKVLFKTVLRSYFADKEIQEQHLRACLLDWVIVRPVRLINGPATDSVRASTEVISRGFDAPTISRANVAGFMLDQLNQPTFLRQCPTLY